VLEVLRSSTTFHCDDLYWLVTANDAWSAAREAPASLLKLAYETGVHIVVHKTKRRTVTLVDVP